MVNRQEHAQTGACISFNILTNIGMEPEEIAIIVSSVGNHDFATFDIHDRVNYAVEEGDVKVDEINRSIDLVLTIDTSICSLMDYFEIFLSRMLLCRKAADFLDCKFNLIINETKML